MERIKNKIKNASLKTSFIYAVLCTVIIVVALSGTTIWGCISFQTWLVPDLNEVFLNIKTTYSDGSEVEWGSRMVMGEDEEEEFSWLVSDEDTQNKNMEQDKENVKYSIDKIENSYMTLTPKRKIAYLVSKVAMIGLPMVYSIIGILLCALWFYKNKLDKPIQILSSATENISAQNLDFSVEYDSKDEMGVLCDSFEKMRKELYQNNRELWNMLEERRMLQASVAHDLRNPIAIIEGYAEYLQINLSKGKIDGEQMLNIASNMSQSAKRLERYTESISDINRLEELKIYHTKNMLPDLLNEITEDLTVIAEQKDIEVKVCNIVSKCQVMLDKQVLYRILENIFTNAVRYAEKEINVQFSMDQNKLITVISDDGPGFSEKILKTKNRYIFSMDKSGGHMGMGLVISNILCKKHGGELQIKNGQKNGAVVTIIIEVR